jgi:hypothetical protein
MNPLSNECDQFLDQWFRLISTIHDSGAPGYSNSERFNPSRVHFSEVDHTVDF